MAAAPAAEGAAVAAAAAVTTGTLPQTVTCLCQTTRGARTTLRSSSVRSSPLRDRPGTPLRSCSIRPLAGSKATQGRRPGSTQPSRSRYEAYNGFLCLPSHATARGLWCKLWLRPSGSLTRASGPEAAEDGAETTTLTTTTAAATTLTRAAPQRQRRQRRRLPQPGHHGARHYQRRGTGVGISQKAAHIPTTRTMDATHRAVAASGVSLGVMQAYVVRWSGAWPRADCGRWVCRGKTRRSIDACGGRRQEASAHGGGGSG